MELMVRNLRNGAINLVQDLNNVKVEAEKQVGTGTITPIAFDNDYFEIYPSAFITYSPSEKNSYQLSYSRRVDRPGLVVKLILLENGVHAFNFFVWKYRT